MKFKKSLLFIIFAFLTHGIIFPMAGEEAYIDPDLEGFTMIEVSKEPAKKAANEAEEAKKMIIKAQKKLQAIKDVAQSDELEAMVNTTQQIVNSIRKLVFKSGPGFQITNKTLTPIWVTVVSNGRIKTNHKIYGCDKVEPGEKFTLELRNLKENMLFGIYLNNPNIVNYSIENDNLKPMPDYLYETTEGAQGKTKYLTWNPEKHKTVSKYLYPQTGRLAGLAKGSRSNYSLNNNIKSFQIVLKEMKEEEVEETE